MAIQKVENLTFENKKIRMIIAGFPGIGKTTLASSAPKPLLIDLDKGLDRVEPEYRVDRIVCENYDELIADLSGDLNGYETLIIDTGGRLFDFLKPVVISDDPKNAKRNGSLSLMGYGANATKYKDFLSFVNGLNKHLIIIFHAKEDKDGDDTKLRILIEGQMKDLIWQDMDLGGFIEMSGKKRTIGFTNCERYFAKGTHGIKGVYEIPELKEGEKNTFLTDLFNVYLKNLNDSTKNAQVEKEKYDTAMHLLAFIEKANSLEQINQFMQKTSEMEHALTSERELKFAVNNKAKELGFIYDREQNAYVINNAKPIK